MEDTSVRIFDFRAPETEYNIGSIIKFQAHDFMTFSDIIVYPGPTLNVVIGPNGTGKSSFVCGLCMGLGGKTQLLGRADQGREYIRRGCYSAWLEITLKAEPRNYIVRREMRIDGDGFHNVFKVNNVQKSQKELNQLMQDLNIQLDNLCQFLPQDKVVEFARLNPMELLIATEKALGDATLYNQHMKLIELREAFKQHEEARNATDDNLRHLEQEQEKQQRDYERFQRRDALRKEAKNERRKAKWIDVAAKQRAAQAAEASLKEAQERLAEIQNVEHRETRPVRRLKEQEAKAATDFKQQQAVMKVLDKQFIDGIQRMTDLGNKFHSDLTEDLKGLKGESETRKLRIRQCQQALQQAKQALQDYPPTPPEDHQQLEQLEKKYQEVQKKVAELEQSEQALGQDLWNVRNERVRIQNRIQRMEDTKLNRLNILDRSFRGIREAYQWVQEQARQGRFKAQVFGPMALEVDVENPLWAQYLETEVSWNKWALFLALNREDETTLTEFFRSKQWKIPTAAFTENWNMPIKRWNGDASQYAHLGITHTLDEVFKAHPVIKHQLGVGNTYIAAGNYDMDRIKQSGLQRIYTPECFVKVTVSRYNRAAVSTAEMNLSECRLLQHNASGAHLQQSKDELAAKQQEERALEQQQRDLAEQVQRAKADLDEIHRLHEHLKQKVRQHVNKRQGLQQDVQVAMAALKRAEEVPEPLDREAGIRREMEKVAKMLVQETKQTTEVMAKVMEGSHKLAVLELRKQEAVMQLTAADSKEKNHKKLLNQLGEAVRDRDREYKARMADLAQAVNDANAADPKQTGKRLWQEQVDRAQQEGRQPPTAEELLARADQLDDEADTIHVSNPAVAEEFRKRQHDIREQKTALQQQQDRLTETEQQMQEIKGAWLPKLQELINTVNTSFSENFSEIACAGEVVLVEHPDYDKYRVEVRVKFRETEDLQVLTAQRQSGGERSVSTILYLIALQGVTQTPFRVVDEINQGMDPVNERKVFDQLVAAASKPNTPQCFLLTPKLLPGLEFGNKATILCIFNSTHMEPAVSKNLGPVAMFGKRILQQTPIAAA